MITLSTFENTLDILEDWLRRMAERKHYSLEYLKGVIDGAYRVLLNLLPNIKYPDLINTTDPNEQNLIGYVMVFGKSYDIYLDDYGQSFYTNFNDKEYSFGTYNMDVVPELVTLVLADHIKIIMDEVEAIYNDKM